ncbi:class V lanthionine synthetase subunit LxmK [Amycolatopsis sp. NPDC004079]|uniref:class V lanthionine synthetase subunit LxmK n=1 Tax=Amycolatopsis sp. NPDC004079 TaxID=3154549 RepID=UPI0033B352A4
MNSIDEARPWQRSVTGIAPAPEVNRLLRQLGLGTFDRAGTIAFGGRNDNWAGTTTGGTKVFVKRLPDTGEAESSGIARSLAFERAAAALVPGAPLASPQLLGHDEGSRLLVFSLLSNAQPGIELSLAGRLSTELCYRAGEAIATVHGLDPAGLDSVPLFFPPLSWLDGIPWDIVQQNSSAQLAAWQILQDDDESVRALHELRSLEEVVEFTPVHGDLRFDQFIISGDRLYLCDWESFQLADPARDVGAFIGEWLYYATYAIFVHSVSREGSRFSGFGFTHHDIISLGQENLRDVIPRIEAFWAGYRAKRTPDPCLPERAMRFAGWHLYDRLIASAESQIQLNPVAKAAAGIGRGVLLNPEGAAELLGVVQHDRKEQV